MRLPPVAAPLVLVLAMSLTACGSDDGDPPASSRDATKDGEPVAVAITRKGDTFTPNGERVELGLNQTLAITITSDVAGELDVHTAPAQTVEYDAGTSERELVIDRPGVVEIESHDPAVVILQLEVR